VSLVELTDRRWGEGRSKIIRQGEILVLYKSFNISGSNAFTEHKNYVLCKNVFECRRSFVFSFGDSNSLREILDEQFSNSFAFEKIKKRRSDN
jgi:hypothetical protein